LDFSEVIKTGKSRHKNPTYRNIIFIKFTALKIVQPNSYRNVTKAVIYKTWWWNGKRLHTSTSMLSGKEQKHVIF